MLNLTEVQIIRTWATTALTRVLAANKNRGEGGEIAQTVIIVAILAAAAIAIATIIATKFRDKAASIPTG
jgi:hypothetical protein